ncbi:GNAT family N-acetyltransferase [uncultured Roseobacter sp.]|uniref:GNAT family N-acetyltransferase n=1 Tax=uncultured Roseobacter sp. TaxID=114847 RepID=UPI002609DBA4|nr:GNAT family N-acetyltransferase [uncultured Roseobacter sp.]
MIHLATAADAPALAQVFFRAVREGDSPYTEAERQAWMPHPPDPDRWAARLGALDCVLFRDGNEAVGFMTTEPGGYIDLAFILPAHRGRGVFRALYSEIEARARRAGEARLWTHASLMAQPAFQAVGFHVIQHETVERAGQHLRRAEMEKGLA